MWEENKERSEIYFVIFYKELDLIDVDVRFVLWEMGGGSKG